MKAVQLELKAEKSPIEKYVEDGLALLSNLITIYNKSDYERKRALIGSIFSGKLVVSKTECRTTETNKVIELFTRNNGQLEGIKKGTNSEKSGLSLLVPLTLLKSNQFINDLKQLYELNNLLSRNHYS